MRSASPSMVNANSARAQPSQRKMEGTVRKINLGKAANEAGISQSPVTPLQNNVGMGTRQVKQERPENGACSSEGPAGSCTEANNPAQLADQKIYNAIEVQETSNVVSRNDVNAEMHAATSPNVLVQLSSTGSGSLAGSSDESFLQLNQASELASKQTNAISKSDLQAPARTSDKGVGESGSEKAPLSSTASAEPPNIAEVSLITLQEHTLVAEPVGESNSTVKHDVQDSQKEVATENCIEASNESKKPTELSSDGLQNVEWVGSAIRSIEGKTYYHSFCIGGITYGIYNYALLPSSQNQSAL